MTRRIAALLFAVLSVALPMAAHAGVMPALSPPPVDYFRLPVAIAGATWARGSTGVAVSATYGLCSGAGPTGVYCQRYAYSVTANVASWRASRPAPSGSYGVTVFKMAADARAFDRAARSRSAMLPEGAPLPYAVLRGAPSSTEWIREGVVAGGACYAVGGIIVRNAAIAASVLNPAPIGVPRAPACVHELNWITRVLAALDTLTDGAAGGGPVPFPASASSDPPVRDVPAVRVAVDPNPTTAGADTIVTAIAAPGATCSVRVVYAAGSAAGSTAGHVGSSASLQQTLVVGSAGTVAWMWVPPAGSADRGPATAAVTCVEGSGSVNGTASFTVQ